jgi:hypothetical protein
MGRRDELLKKWRDNTPTDAPVSEVKSVVEHFFGDSQKKGTRGSHIVVKDKRLKDKGEFGPLGRFEIPIKGGQKVKGIYLRRLVSAIDIVMECEEADK